jgi:hypothetical protein
MTTRKYTVLYTTTGHPTPVSFVCQASSPTDARAQCTAAHPGCSIVVVR